MNGTLEKCSTNNLLSPWKAEYEYAIAAGISVDELLDNLEEDLKVAESEAIWNHKDLENVIAVEDLAKKAISYDERFAYLQKIKKKSGKTM